MNIIQLIREGADLIEAAPEAWTRKAFARDVTGSPTSPLSPKAICWCWAGSLVKLGRFAFRGPVPPSYNAAVEANDTAKTPAEAVANLRALALKLESQS